ncbi:iron-containing alcohol dehydrogenase [Pseudomonas capsici]|uniref:Iron-containing alcohol dehydrogenase n=1 Tax=Pseudomonas capsici TaxID=2810614 RepID=A0ABT3BUJ7_9PSED|nr:iron-containing alcohol dehydrogenase [Pseudomonas capsici]MBX8612201.1 iron-containing alcohol dehydrogenase [Pseudomonas cichorii]MCV4263406.1 iron-containing alcohol dehydrogenase [Pseudomonas capsici]MCV4266118.1 iron-containing alcohol dehydrogenase [Pseudomonas capsici]MCV4274600.1 iron-containing alcohol dehydrogenase [Pseudomonas capsici]MCV4277277.1 iron-containing alcohol dehydrogenase [Pseudomonas capsici]
MHTNDWNYPTSIRVGAGRVSELADACRVTGIKRPLLITDTFLGSTDMIHNAVADCREALGHCGLFDQVKGNPTGDNVANGLLAYKSGGHDGVIAFGGGSALDAAKAVALMSGQTRPLWDFEDIGQNHLRADPLGIAPVIALPTTAGTGSEVGRASVITDEEARVKRTILHIRMLPRIAILDANLTLDLPAQLTAATGADALTHCMEAYCSPVYHPMAEAVAVKGMQLIKAYLPRVVADGHDLEARQQMLVASSLGAAAFQRGLGGVHAIAQSLGALYDLHHGLLNAILLPYVLQANESALTTQMDDLAVYLRLPRPGFEGVMQWLLQLREEIGIPHTLGAIGLDERDAELVGRMAFADGCSHTNPIPHSAQVYSQIFSHAVRGQ